MTNTTGVDLEERIKAAKDAYNKLSPVDRAIHDLKQKRSGMIGLSDFDQPRETIEKHIDASPEFVILAELERLRALASPGVTEAKLREMLGDAMDRTVYGEPCGKSYGVREGSAAVPHDVVLAFGRDVAALTSPASPHSVTPEGWKLVPVEPTREIKQAILRGLLETRYDDTQLDDLGWGDAERVYKTLLISAPSPPGSATRFLRHF